MPLLETGLSAAQVAERHEKGQDNRTAAPTSRSFTQILRGNIFTLFNGILMTALVVVLIVGDVPDAVFGFVIIFNALIGIVQEYRAKRTLDQLAVLSAPNARVIRDGQETEIETDEIVLGDLMLASTGDQIAADSVVMGDGGAEIDESLLTGESDPIIKQTGDEVLSGSFVVSGSAKLEVVRVGAEAYANQLTAQARRFSLVHSELRAGVNRVLVWITWGILPLAALIVWSQLQVNGADDWRRAVVFAVAGIVGMIPEGLVLLTSISFGLAAITLARKMVLVQELAAVEVLARVDVICLDKTGTLTEGVIEVDRVVMLGDESVPEHALHAFAFDPEANPTTAALRGLDFTNAESAAEVVYTVPFSSARKWSAVSVDGQDWVLGAPEVMLATRDDAEAQHALGVAAEEASRGRRTLLLAATSTRPVIAEPLSELEPLAIVLLRERVRPDAEETLDYFRDQNVDLRIISGDNPVTVAAVAREVGVEGAIGFDARNLPEDPDEMVKVLAEHRVFGRVTPEQKRGIVHALQGAGHTVAMTGDGVNDALALKDADLGIAMGSGAPATKAVARLILLDGRFSRLPGVVAEGRRVIANIERVSNLYLTKTTWAILLGITIALLGVQYPFLPRHLTVIGALTIGIPSFFLAIAPNKQRYRPGFLPRVLSFTLPVGLVSATTVVLVYLFALNTWGEGPSQRVATLTMVCTGLWVLGILARPFTWWKVCLVGVMIVGTVGVLTIPFFSWWFALTIPTGPQALAIVIAAAVGCLAIEGVSRWLTPWLQSRLPERQAT